MARDLESFLAPLTAFVEEAVVWTTGPMRLSCFLTDKAPPARYVTSARAVVTGFDQVLVVQDLSDKHILPGGRLEANETPLDAARREVLEETGWSMTGISQIGILHFSHTEAAPEGYPFPYPDFLQIVYAGSPAEYQPEMREPDDYVLGSELVPIESIRKWKLDAGQHVFLEAALRALASL